MASSTSSPTGSSAPSDDVLTFIARIEQANHNSPDISEDDTNESWGHYQYTASALMHTTVLKSWDSVGNINTACRLIAAAIKTCKVARYLCFARHISPTSYLSNIYLQKIVELLSQLWSATGNDKVRSLFSYSHLLVLTLVFADTIKQQTHKSSRALDFLIGFWRCHLQSPRPVREPSTPNRSWTRHRFGWRHCCHSQNPSAANKGRAKGPHEDSLANKCEEKLHKRL
jgi:hypothetical protein